MMILLPPLPELLENGLQVRHQGGSGGGGGRVGWRAGKARVAGAREAAATWGEVAGTAGEAGALVVRGVLGAGRWGC